MRRSRPSLTWVIKSTLPLLSLHVIVHLGMKMLPLALFLSSERLARFSRLKQNLALKFLIARETLRLKRSGLERELKRAAWFRLVRAIREAALARDLLDVRELIAHALKVIAQLKLAQSR